MPNLSHLAILSVTGVAAGFLNVVAGGGSLLTLPVLIWLGLPETTANGTSRLAILVQCLTAMWAFQRKGKLQTGQIWQLGGPTLLGAGAGALVAANMPNGNFRSLLGTVMLGCALLVVINPKGGGEHREPRLSARFVWPVLGAIGLYGGLIQAGVGYLILAGLTLVLRLPLAVANVQKSVLVALYTPLALGVFLWKGQVDLPLALVLCAGQALGAWLGARAALERGEKFIRVMLALVVTGSSLALLLK